MAITAYAGFGRRPTAVAGADRGALSLTVVVVSALVSLPAIESTQSALRAKLWQALGDCLSAEDFPLSCQIDPQQIVLTGLATARAELFATRAALTHAAK